RASLTRPIPPSRSRSRASSCSKSLTVPRPKPVAPRRADALSSIARRFARFIFSGSCSARRCCGARRRTRARSLSASIARFAASRWACINTRPTPYTYHLTATYVDRNYQPAPGAQLQALRVASAAPHSELLEPQPGGAVRDRLNHLDSKNLEAIWREI